MREADVRTRDENSTVGPEAGDEAGGPPAAQLLGITHGRPFSDALEKTMSENSRRPCIICHMLAALDGRINGPFMSFPSMDEAGAVYEETNQSYGPDAWLCGRVTTDANFTFSRRPDLREDAPIVPEGDFVAEAHAPMYYASVDASDRLGWKSATLRYADRPPAHVIEILTGRASNDYKDFLRRLKISYIIAGERELDLELECEKLRRLFDIRTLMVSGGGGINYSFLHAGLINELSIVLQPALDGTTSEPSLFDHREGMAPIAAEFRLKAAKTYPGGTLWLRYLPKAVKPTEPQA